MCGARVPRRMDYCPDPTCRARVTWNNDKSVELYVVGIADEVESVTRRLVSGLRQSRTAAPEDVEDSTGVAAGWPRSRKAWAFVVGLATVAGGAAAVLALFVH
jgi:hypothetical protein